MSYSVEPRLHPVAIADLRPTQITVGMREVEMKQVHWRAEREEKGADFLGRHAVPVVVGPKRRLYLIDHHHLALALHLEGEEQVLTTEVADLSRLGKDEFWSFLDSRSWMHPLDAEGRRRGHDQIPRKVSGLVDDPYRSLAGALRLAGGYAKTEAPFSEFLWADFLRRRIKRAVLERSLAKALERALGLARSREAEHLPGWCGPSD
ncbi:chromosome partitioning protein ParB [Bosea sp. Tri-44]|uniref:ParB-like protein n=1 Tax=Bosea sp. Tri-44 TaxID=1972137 RepID=UPI00100E6D12|nr:ParB-like protein [Bosea sp. Tri-44]RXT52666.1 chromosome partitioning protein ParB [Bosea sp. Tri-44]